MTLFYKGVTGLNKFLILNCCEGFALWNAGSVFKRAQLLFRHLCKNLGHWGCFMSWIFANMWLWEPQCSLWDPELLKQPRFSSDAKIEWRLFARGLCFPSRSPSPSSHFGVAPNMNWGEKYRYLWTRIFNDGNLGQLHWNSCFLQIFIELREEVSTFTWKLFQCSVSVYCRMERGKQRG